jgi:hypothetical protein
MNSTRNPHQTDSVRAAAIKAAPVASPTIFDPTPAAGDDDRDGIRGEPLQLKLFLRHECPSCSERAVAQEVRQLHHVRRVRMHPDRHEIDVWIDHPEHGLMREIGGILDLFCCQLAACHLR